MRLRWVSRETYDRHTQVLIDAQGSLAQQNEWLRDAYDKLLEKYHDLKVQGAAKVEPLPVLETREFDPIADAITRKAGANLQLRGLMGRRAAQEKAAGVSIMNIVERIESGITDDEGPHY